MWRFSRILPVGLLYFVAPYAYSCFASGITAHKIEPLEKNPKTERLLDSLLWINAKIQGDSLQIVHLLDNAGKYNIIRPELSLLLAQKALHRSIRLTDTRLQAESQRLYAFANQRMGLMSVAMRNYLSAVELFGQIQDSNGLAYCYNGLGIINFEQKKYEQALQYYNSAAAIFSRLKNIERHSAALSNIAYCFIKQKRIDSAEYYTKQSIIINKPLQNDTAAFTLMSLGEIALFKENFQSAESYAVHSLKKVQATPNKIVETRALNLLGMTYLAKKQYTQSLYFLELGLQTAREMKLAYRIWDSYEILSFAEQTIGNYRKALLYKTKAQESRDSLIAEEISLSQVVLEAKHERERRQRETDILMENNRQQKTLLIILGCSTLLVAVFALIVYNLYKRVSIYSRKLEAQRNETLRQKVIVEEQSLSIQQINALLAERNTELEDANTELFQLNHNLQEADEKRVQMLSVVSHDLKSPLSSMLMTSEFLQQNEFLDDISRDLLANQVHSINRMNNLIRELLDTAAQELGTMNLEKAPFNFLAVLNRVIDEISPILQEKKQHIFAPSAREIGTPLIMLGDEGKMFQVIENLISNASKFSPIGSTITIQVTEKIHSIIFSVADEGPGLTDDDKSKLFGFFQRLSAKPTGKEHSSGVGLAIIHKIVKLHGGNIWCESALGHGATFIVEIPKPAPKDELSQDS
ncbi:MAG: ATP-binding protein [Candidatus Kapaibacteriota bacterium]|jgi:signal transduction histidine kinase